jgi:hypothetical protein
MAGQGLARSGTNPCPAVSSNRDGLEPVAATELCRVGKPAFFSFSGL